MKKLAFIISLIAATPAMADEVSVIGHSLSTHVEDHNYNTFNYGAGVRLGNEVFGYQVGMFKNSINKVGAYGLLDWNLVRHEFNSCIKVGAGIFAGIATGYITPRSMPLPVAGLQASIYCDRVFVRFRAAPDVYLSSKGVATAEIGYIVAKF